MVLLEGWRDGKERKGTLKKWDSLQQRFWSPFLQGTESINTPDSAFQILEQGSTQTELGWTLKPMLTTLVKSTTFMCKNPQSLKNVRYLAELFIITSIQFYKVQLWAPSQQAKADRGEEKPWEELGLQRNPSSSGSLEEVQLSDCWTDWQIRVRTIKRRKRAFCWESEWRAVWESGLGSSGSATPSHKANPVQTHLFYGSSLVEWAP